MTTLPQKRRAQPRFAPRATPTTLPGHAEASEPARAFTFAQRRELCSLLGSTESVDELAEWVAFYKGQCLTVPARRADLAFTLRAVEAALQRAATVLASAHEHARLHLATQLIFHRQIPLDAFEDELRAVADTAASSAKHLARAGRPAARLDNALRLLVGVCRLVIQRTGAGEREARRALNLCLHAAGVTLEQAAAYAERRRKRAARRKNQPE